MSLTQETLRLRLFTEFDQITHTPEKTPLVIGGKFFNPIGISDKFINAGKVPLQIVDGVQVINVDEYRAAANAHLRDLNLRRVPSLAEQYSLPVGSEAFARYQQIMQPLRTALSRSYEAGDGYYNIGSLAYFDKKVGARYLELRSETGALTHLGATLLFRDCASLFGDEVAYELQRWEILPEVAMTALQNFNPDQSPDPFESDRLLAGTGLTMRAFLIMRLLEEIKWNVIDENKHHQVAEVVKPVWTSNVDPDYGFSIYDEKLVSLVAIAGSCYGNE